MEDEKLRLLQLIDKAKDKLMEERDEEIAGLKKQIETLKNEIEKLKNK
jgi:hypothetical protein